MKVLFVCSGNSKWGINPIVKNQGESLKTNGMYLDFYTIKGKGIRGYLGNISNLRKQIRKNNYDIIHAHYSLSGAVCLLTFSKKPIVLSLMGSDSYGSYNIDGDRIKSSYMITFITQIIKHFVEGIIVKSKNIYNNVHLNSKTHIIPNGVNFKQFKPDDSHKYREKLKLSYDKKIILYLANPENPRKNFNLLKEALYYIQTENFEFINPYPIDNSIFPEYLNTCDVFVLTSYNEGSPNVIKEAMACNCPIVSTDVGDVKEVIGNTEGCYICSYDPKDVADKLKLALEFADKKGRTNGRERIIKLGLDSETIVKKIIKVYKSVLIG